MWAECRVGRVNKLWCLQELTWGATVSGRGDGSALGPWVSLAEPGVSVQRPRLSLIGWCRGAAVYGGRVAMLRVDPPALSSSTPLRWDRWLSLPPMPTPRAGAAVAVLGKQLLVVGGMGKDQRPLKAVEVYNTEEGKWRKRCSLREASMGLSVTVKGNQHGVVFTTNIVHYTI